MVASVSVVIPTYNHAAFLAEAIESALRQTVPPLDVIVVDDGSTDETPEVCRHYAIVYERLIRSGGPAKPRNIGISLASGSIIAFLDADDKWFPHKLQAQLPRFDDPNVGLIYSDVEIWEAGRRRDQTMLAQSSPKEGNDVLGGLLQDNFVPMSSVLVRKSLLEKVGGFDERPDLHGVEDYHLWLRLAIDGTGFAFVSEALVQYREIAGSLGDAGAEQDLHRLLTVYANLPAVSERYEALVRWRKFATTVALARTVSPLSQKVALGWRAALLCPYRKLLWRLTHKAHA